jgi:poly-gamma-glutamate synthase PgsB/CapB
LALVDVWLNLACDPVGLERLREAEALLRASTEGEVVVADRGALAQCTARQLLDVLFLIAHDDLDMVARPRSSRELSLDVAPAGGWEIEVGLRRRTRSWRVVHEVTHPRNDKRQAWPHTHDEAPEGPVIAWSSRLSEVVATSVAGRRVATPTQLDWAEHLPPVATLYAAKQWGVAWSRTADGLTTVEAQPTARDLAKTFVPLCEVRQRLTSTEPERAREDWRMALAREGYAWTQAPPLHALALGWQWWTDLGVSDASSERDAALIGAASIAAWGATRLTEELRVRRAREAIPLVIGGWGSRGKSSVERMKAAMFQGMGYSVMCKSTGCEAMVLLATPGADAQEIFLYRARDKASLHEQRRVMDAAAVLRPQVFVYESMALNPTYTELLQQGWMHDDYTTITNTYPDHEDIQGPSGRDVADVIAAFTPVRGTLITTEQHMTPVLARKAAAHQSRFLGCGPEHWALLPRDLLERFPDWAYDRNVALVAALGAELGIAEDEAIRAMADHVVVDLGAFKTYGPLDVASRSLRFLCGNSANDRASFLSNWERARLDDIPPRSGLTDWQVVVFNNRGDRLARQAMFAKIAALDTCADRIVLIGTNVLPMRDQIVREIREQTIPAWIRLGEGPEGRARLARELARRLRRPALAPEEQPGRTSGARPPIADEADWYSTQVAWSEECAWLHTLASTDRWSIETVARQAAERLTKRLLAFPNPKLTGDQILERLATLAPAGSRVDILGAQNIRGTGLDLVYRWTSVDRVSRWLDDVTSDDTDRIREGLTRLTTWDGWGFWDAQMAEGVLRAHAAKAEASGLDEEWQAALTVVSEWRSEREVRLKQGTVNTGGLTAALAALWRRADVVGSVRRRWQADRLYRDLVRFDIGRARAADEARRLLDAERA